MTKRYSKPLTAKKIAAIADDAIDFSDIPEMPASFWANAELVTPDTTQAITIRIKQSVLEAYKKEGKGYQTRMNAVLETYAMSQLNYTPKGGTHGST